MTEVPEVSIIIPLHRWGERSARSVTRCLELRQSSSVEVIVVSDRPIDEVPRDAALIVTGSSSDTSPAIKRDIGRSIARGHFLAYIDDDAFPEFDWIDRALEAIRDLRVDGVGGPGLTPNDSNWRERLSGAVYGSILGSGPLRYRFVAHSPARVVNEVPAYNFIVKSECIDAVGGWNSSFYGGEDTDLCTRLRSQGFRLGYTPDAVVYHYRRPPRHHLRQVGNVGRHRGYFVRRRDASSLRGMYFAPTLIAVSFPIGVGLAAIGAIRQPLLTLGILAGLWMALAGLAIKDVGMRAILFPVVLLAHHLWYGVNFIYGLITRTLDSERDLHNPP
ncbi:MAG TPA: glycosyltransferase [Acidimicrobiales bacterium]|nr:glycosyltransferase [Acidimicrobiales bacterium]